jgi:hypothetical protein
MTADGAASDRCSFFVTVHIPELRIYCAVTGDKSTEDVSGYTHGIFRFGHAFAPARS